MANIHPRVVLRGGRCGGAWPAFAAGFSGFYLPLMIVLWLLMLRGRALELRSHIRHAVWSGLWDSLFFVGSTLLAVFYGAALPNVVRGVPLDARGYFFEPLCTDFNPSSATPGILDWFTPPGGGGSAHGASLPKSFTDISATMAIASPGHHSSF